MAESMGMAKSLGTRLYRYLGDQLTMPSIYNLGLPFAKQIHYLVLLLEDLLTLKYRSNKYRM